MLHLFLENGYKTVEIVSILGLSRETVRVHKRMWEHGGPTYKKIINIMARKENTKLFISKLEKLLMPLNLALRAKNDMKARAKLLGGDWND